jgi:EpsI family protein
MNLTYRFLVMNVLLASMGLYMGFHTDLEVPIARSFEEFPPSHAGWRMAGQATLADNVLRILKPSDYLSRRYVGLDGVMVDMYLSYFDGGPDSGGIHSPKHCLPGSGWSELSSDRIVMELGGEPINLVRAVYGHGEVRDLVYYWFTMRGKTMSDEYSLKAAEIVGSMFHRRRDQSFIRISVQATGDTEMAQRRVEDFLRDFYPVIKGYLPS